MTVIYGLREIGDQEFRYVGRSDKPLPYRLNQHCRNAKRNYPPLVSTWINGAGKIEIVPITKCDPAVACAVERATVHALSVAGHRLTNSHLALRPTSPEVRA